MSDRWTRALTDLEPDAPTGAWGKSNGGIRASRGDVDYNRSRLPADPYSAQVVEAAASRDLPTAVLMALFDRESNHGRSLDSRGYGDYGNGFGVGQVDSRYWEQKGAPDPYSLEHMKQCADIFCMYLDQVQVNHSDWADKYVLKGAAVAYNSGVSNVQTINGMDRGTTGNDYGADVMARAQYWGELL